MNLYSLNIINSSKDMPVDILAKDTQRHGAIEEYGATLSPLRAGDKYTAQKTYAAHRNGMMICN
jgi:hypothetical protein